MPFNAQIDSITRGGDPLTIDVGTTYTDDSVPEWRCSQILHVTIDPALSQVAQRAALQAAVRDNAALYKRQIAIHAGLKSLEGNAVQVP